MARWDGKVPFDVEGNLIYNSPPANTRGVALVPNATPTAPGIIMQVFYWPNTVFDAELRYLRFERGNSSVRFIFGVIIIEEPDFEVTMFLSDFDKAIHLYGFDGQSIKGKWTYRKMGTHYGICPKE